MSENINTLIKEKIRRYPEKVQKIMIKALELAEFNQATAIAEQLEGFVRGLTKK